MISSNLCGRSRNRSPAARLLSLSFFCFGFLVNRASCLVPPSVAGLEDVLDEFCGGDVEDELVPEFGDNPETTRGTNFSVLPRIFFPCLVRCGFLPLAHSQVPN